MATVKVRWSLPTTRESGLPLDPADIAGVELSLSADGGANFGLFDTYPPSVLEAQVTELEPGTWVFRGVVVDSDGRRSAPRTAVQVIEDATPPGALLTLELALG